MTAVAVGTAVIIPLALPSADGTNPGLNLRITVGLLRLLFDFLFRHLQFATVPLGFAQKFNAAE